MKSLVTCVIIFASLQLADQPSRALAYGTATPTGNIFIITLDGFRWQEVFTGADSTLINNEKYTPDAATMKMLYWAPDAEGRRKKLLPFFWNILAVQGQIYGNRLYNNKVNTANPYSISYPGYNEILTGNPDITISSNSRNTNPNITVLEYLNSKARFNGKVAAFTSWNVFPYILNKERSGIVVNSGYETMEDKSSTELALINEVQEEAVIEKKPTRHDLLTFLTAKEYIRKHRPNVVFLGLGETDEAGHDRRYDLYLEKANEADRMIAGLWHWVQTTPGYKDNTTFIITTDHGRGSKAGKWSNHGMFIKGSSQTWFAAMGPSITPAGEIHGEQQLYQEQIAATIGELLGEEFKSNQPVADAISLR